MGANTQALPTQAAQGLTSARDRLWGSVCRGLEVTGQGVKAIPWGKEGSRAATEAEVQREE